MAKVINEARYKELSVAAKNSDTLSLAAKLQGVSPSTMRRVNKTKNYTEFKAQLVSERGPGYAKRRASSTIAPTQKKPGFLRKIANFFDIPSQP